MWQGTNAGFDNVDNFRDYFVSGSADVVRYNRKALGLIDACHRVVAGIARMAIGGSEGTISMLAKTSEKND